MFLNVGNINIISLTIYAKMMLIKRKLALNGMALKFEHDHA